MVADKAGYERRIRGILDDLRLQIKQMQIMVLRLRLAPLLYSLLLAVVVLGCQRLDLPQPVSGNVNLTLGNPSHAQRLDPERYHLFERSQYGLLYDRTTRSPAWASWQLTTDWLGTLARPPFTPDPDLPPGWSAVKPQDYTGSGFDRGHIVPAADRNRTALDSAAVFYMTNIVPQAPDNNRGPWEALERYCRALAKTGKELFIMAGPTGQGGIGEKGSVLTIADNTIPVPAALWKIIVVNDRPGQGLKGITADTRVIAVLIPNQQGIKEKGWRGYRTTVKALEAQTGYDFLANVPAALQTVLEGRRDR